MPKYKVQLKWETTVDNADSEAEAIEVASEQLYDDMTRASNELMWNVKQKS